MSWPLWPMYTMPTMVARKKQASRAYLSPDFRGRVAIGRFARHDLYLLTIDAAGVITLTPAAVLPPTAPVPPVVRKRAASRKATARQPAAAGADEPQKQEEAPR
jgi:hypothetical protein